MWDMSPLCDTHTHTHKLLAQCWTQYISSSRGAVTAIFATCALLVAVLSLAIAARSLAFHKLFLIQENKINICLWTRHGSLPLALNLTTKWSLTSEGNKHCNRIIPRKPISKRVSLLHHPTQRRHYTFHRQTDDHSKTTKCSQLLCRHILHYFTTSLTVTIHTASIIKQGVSKRALQLWKRIEIYTEDLTNPL